MERITEACPYCGGNSFKVKPLWKGEYHFVACNECKAAGPIAKDPDECVRLFNTRKPPRQEAML